MVYDGLIPSIWWIQEYHHYNVELKLSFGHKCGNGTWGMATCMALMWGGESGEVQGIDVGGGMARNDVGRGGAAFSNPVLDYNFGCLYNQCSVTIGCGVSTAWIVWDWGLLRLATVGADVCDAWEGCVNVDRFSLAHSSNLEPLGSQPPGTS